MFKVRMRSRLQALLTSQAATQDASLTTSSSSFRSDKDNDNISIGGHTPDHIDTLCSEASTASSFLSSRDSDVDGLSCSNCSIPSIIWSELHSPPQESSSSTLDIREFSSHISCAVFPDPESASLLTITAHDVFDAGKELLQTVKSCVENGDYSVLLTPKQLFEVATGIPDSPISVGTGIEVEVVSAAWAIIQAQHSRFFIDVYGGHASLAVSTPAMLAGVVSGHRLLWAGVLGAMTGLMLVHGLFPDPLGPLFLQFALHGGNLHSLSESFLREWAPDLYGYLARFRDLGPAGDASHFRAFFISYVGLQIETLQDRDFATHNAIVSLMLYNAAIGPEPPLHPEMQAFLRAFRLPTSNGFDLCETIRTYSTHSFLSIISTTHVSSFQDISDRIMFIDNPAVGELPQVLGQMEGLFAEFLCGTGIPIPELWEDVKGSFHPMVDLKNVNEQYFRPQIFMWAVTGSPRIRNDLLMGEVNVGCIFILMRNATLIPNID
ncbi:hypothetical protein VKT23_004618 [Stygiomarasmius scandens]|uniref:Uncharacterized protein n=1 Tax=Marasmiellus scandens TaxID=2682957 RepID=A0ABR1JVF2_9AGAR